MYQINFDSAIPIYEQIVRQAKFLIASGAYATGSMIPSVREVAKTWGVNPQTVAKAYRDLKLQGLLRPLRGCGLVVKDGARAKCRKERIDLLQKRVEETFTEAAVGQLSKRDLISIVETTLQKILDEYYPSDEENK